MTRPSGTIILACEKCGRLMSYDHSLDPTLPTNVAKIVQSFCDRPACDEPGSYHSEQWFDADGKEIIPT